MKSTAATAPRKASGSHRQVVPADMLPAARYISYLHSYIHIISTELLRCYSMTAVGLTHNFYAHMVTHLSARYAIQKHFGPALQAPSW